MCIATVNSLGTRFTSSSTLLSMNTSEYRHKVAGVGIAPIPPDSMGEQGFWFLVCCKVNVNYFLSLCPGHFDGRYRLSTDFFLYGSTSTVDIDQCLDTMDRIDCRYRAYSPAGELASTVDIDCDILTFQ